MKRIALVEDNVDNRLLVQAILEDRCELHEYGDGPSAIRAMRESPPDLVLLDVSLPGMDGGEVLRLLRSEPSLSRVPVVALTAHAMKGDRERFLAAGFDDYVSKPILDERTLLGVVERWLG